MIVVDELKLQLLKLLGASEQIERLRQEMSSKNVEISQLTETVKKLQADLDRSELEAMQLNENAADLKLRCDQLLSSMENLNNTLKEKDRVIEDISAALERQRRQDKLLSDQRVQTFLEDLFRGVAGPACQMMTLLHRIRAGGELAASDIAAVGQSMVSSLTDGGLAIGGEIDETTIYRADLHEGLVEGFADGEVVEIKMPSVHFREHLLRKAVVVRPVVAPDPSAAVETLESVPSVSEGGS